MTKTLRFLVVTTLAVGLVGGIAWTKGKPVKTGGGGNPGHLNVIAFFDAFLSPNGDSDMVWDSSGPQYDVLNIGDGWVRLPGTGNFTIGMGGGRSIELDLTEPLDPLPVSGSDEELAYEDFLEAHGTPGAPEDGGIVSLSGFSINQHCLVKDLLDENHDPEYFEGDKNYYGCGMSDLSVGSLKVMEFDSNTHDHSVDLLLRFTPIISGSSQKKGRFNVNCGARGAPDPDLGGTTSFMIAHCNQAISSSDDTCAEWRIVPYYKGAINLGPVTEGAENICERPV